MVTASNFRVITILVLPPKKKAIISSEAFYLYTMYTMLYSIIQESSTPLLSETS
jgi:hypothetical protein